ncbi:MAG: hypothetical protein OK422_01220 [Thaumarchaeota archaeon]|nr:hypothetical protein [Nitrososphaerota archaeon]
MKKLASVASSVLAFLGGILILIGGFGTQSFLLSLFPYIQNEAVVYLPGIASVTVSLAILVLSLLIGLGGFTVITGALALFFEHVRSGRLLIALGGGAGFLGLGVSFLYSLLVKGYPLTSEHLAYWFGLALAVGARWLAGQSR